MVFIPLSDDNPLRSIHFQWVTISLIAINVAVFLLQNSPIGQATAASFALVPSELFQVHVMGGSARGPYDAYAVPEGYTLLCYMFLHGDILHLSSNMLFLWVFGDNVEDAMGHIKFLIFYLLCGVAGGLAHAIALPDLEAAADRCERRGRRRHCRLSHPASARDGVGAGVPLHPAAHLGGLGARLLGADPVRDGDSCTKPMQVAWWAHIGGMVAVRF